MVAYLCSRPLNKDQSSLPKMLELFEASPSQYSNFHQQSARQVRQVSECSLLKMKWKPGFDLWSAFSVTAIQSIYIL